MIAALHVLAVVVAGSCEFESCADFCTGSCPFRPNISSAGTEALVVYRMTPWNVTDLTDHNSGDAAGDMGFLLDTYLHDNKCLPPYTTDNCFLEDRTLMGRFPVLFDAAYGPFLKCNPTHIPDPASPTGYSPYLNMSDWLCAWGLPPPKNPWTPHRSWQTDCIPYDTNHTCPRLNVSVGKDPAEHEFYRRKDLLPTHFEGYWYTTPRRGRCGPNQSPSDGSGCTWTVTAEPSFINASCLVGRLFDVLEDYNPACFRNCTGGANRTDPCFRQCVTATVVATANSSGMPTAPMVAAWERAFVPGTGCPRVNVSTPTDYPPPSPATSPAVAVWS